MRTKVTFHEEICNSVDAERHEFEFEQAAHYWYMHREEIYDDNNYIQDDAIEEIEA
jgi:hypothetical protein